MKIYATVAVRCHPHTDTWQWKNWPSAIWITFEVPHILISLHLTEEKQTKALCVREHFFLRKLRNIFPRFMNFKTEHNRTLLINFPTLITSKGRLWLTSIRAKLFKCWIYIVSLLLNFVLRPKFKFHHAANINMATVAVLKRIILGMLWKWHEDRF
jgi:hypothetical protein